MSVIETDRVTDNVVDDGDHDKFAHVVAPAHKLTEAMVMGKPVEAICGKIWVPTRAPDNFQVCPECKDIMKKLGRDIG